MRTQVRPYIHPYGYCAQRCQACSKLAASGFHCLFVSLRECFPQCVPEHEPEVEYDMKWKTVMPVCLREFVRGGGGLLRGWEAPLGCTCRMQMAGKRSSPPEKYCMASNHKGTREVNLRKGSCSERYRRSQSGKGFPDQKGVPKTGLPVQFLIRKGFLERGSRALPVQTTCACVF